MSDTINNMTVLSFVKDSLGKKLHDEICDNVDIYMPGSVSNPPSPHEISDRKFWENQALDDVDIILLPLSSCDLQELDNLFTQSNNKAISLWAWLPSAIVAVLTEDSLHDAVNAAKLDFDGILTEPFNSDSIRGLLENAKARSKQRNHLSKRYNKLQKAFKQVNKKRHYLRDKVDILCHDLVQSNVNLTNTLLDLRKAYTFQSELMGEYDMRCMLHRGLQQIRNQIPGVSATLYLCQKEEFEAHIVGYWFDGPCEIEDLEDMFTISVIPQTIDNNEIILTDNIADHCSDSEILSEEQSKILSKLSLISAPIITDEQTIGAIVLYRDNNNPLKPDNIDTIKPMLKPFAKTIESLQKLEEILIKDS